MLLMNAKTFRKLVEVHGSQQAMNAELAKNSPSPVITHELSRHSQAHTGIHSLPEVQSLMISPIPQLFQ